MRSSLKLARKNMVDCQIQTTGVFTPGILAAFERLPRESFLPADKKAIAYNDEDIALGNGHFLMSPTTHARMIEILAPKPDDIILNIGDSTGYSSAVLSSLVMTVVTVETISGAYDAMRPLWTELDCNNIAITRGADGKGCPEHAPYSAILLNGAVSEIPACLLSQLVPGGRLVTVLRKPDSPMGTITQVKCDKAGCYSHNAGFDAAVPWLPGMEPRDVFVF